MSFLCLLCYIFISEDRGIFLKVDMAVECNVISEHHAIKALFSRDIIIFLSYYDTIPMQKELFWRRIFSREGIVFKR